MRNALTSLMFLAMLIANTSNAQLLKKLTKSASEAAERTLERKVEEKSEQVTSDAVDEVFDAPSKVATKKRTGNQESAEEPSNNAEEEYNAVTEDAPPAIGQGDNLVTGSSFFPNGNIIYLENFDLDAQGDFPANWETNAGGEVIMMNETKALRMYPNGVYITNTDQLPENYALDFTLITSNLDYKGLSGSGFFIELSNEKSFAKSTPSGAKVGFSLWKGSDLPNKLTVENWGKNVSKIQNSVNYQMGDKLNAPIRFTVVVNGKRLRLFIDNEKAIDVPSLLQDNAGRYFRFSLKGTDNNLQHVVAVADIKITEEGEDIRSLLLKGGFSTTKILFNSGSDEIMQESYEYIQKIGKALIDEPSLKIMIVGHTDSDGDELSNMTLSRARATAVANYLTDYSGIDKDRLFTQGKGETEPLADNASPEGKAQNRRVEFKKL